ncbi:MAG: HAD-IIIC family phosphatase [Lachnospiraceae bacterium]|nr:HAD-IIIC family phosphatase [Lachnospiraceae bacterium]
MKELQYPFDSQYIIKKKKSIKRELLSSDKKFIEKKIAVLGGSTTHDIINITDLFLLDQGIKAEFYESEYAKFWEDVMFDNEELVAFKPDVVYIHTSNRNIRNYPVMGMSKEDVDSCLNADYEYFLKLWEKIRDTYHCPIIQNNFEYPYYRLLGNADATDIHGKVRYINTLNQKFADYTEQNKDFFIQDINYLSACYGLDVWSDPLYWHMYKYALAIEAIPTLCFNLSNIIKSIYGKNKKSLVLDLDNTLWGGIIGDDGVENIEIGQETSMGQVYSEFQSYIKEQKDIGVILNIASKNEPENALAGLNHPDSVLTPDDFIDIKANWDPKSKNVEEIARELNLLPESFVFVDDNPAEREIVEKNLGVAAPDIGSVENYVRILDHSGFFEVTNLSADDAKRNEMYKENMERMKLEQSFSDYGDYLRSLEMKGTIKGFEPIYLDRIAQLTNKSNQFNLTTKRYTRAEIEEVSDSTEYIDLYGRLVDKFGDNGVVSVVIGHIDGDILNMDLWLMSCRVLKRDMEYAMMDELVSQARAKGIKTIKGYFYPTAKNKMVTEFYKLMGFDKISEDAEGNTVWEFKVTDGYTDQNRYIKVNE